MKQQKQDILETGLPRKKAGTSNGVCQDKNKRPVSKKEISIVGFTLVELIVVITILAILGTIAIMAFEGYSKNARDSARTSDISSMKKALELWVLQSGTYPEPTNGTNITYSGATAWTQGTYGATVHQTVGKLDKKPTDPLYDTDYTYSIATSKKEYQLGAVLEGTLASLPTIQQTYAATESKEAFVTGNYNGVVTSTQTGGLYYMLAVPSIILSDINDANLLGIKQFVLHKKSNLPHSYANKSLTMTGTEVNFTPVVVWSGTGYANLNNQTNFDTLVTNIKNAFSGTLFATLPEYTNITSTNQETSKKAVKGIIETSTKQELTKVTTTEIVSNSCHSTVPTNATTTIGSPTSENQAWQTQNSANACHFVCNDGYGFDGTACISATNCAEGLQYITLSNGQSWSCKNLGATTVWDGSTAPTNCGGRATNCNSSLTWIGDYYQWGRNIPTYASGSFINGQSGWNYDWQTPRVHTAWGGSTGDTTTVDGSGTTSIGRQGPCPTGYHVPSVKDWQDMCNNVLGIICTNGMAYNALIATKLRLPFAGYRHRSNAGYYSPGSYAQYWSSSPSVTEGVFPFPGTTDGYNLSFFSSFIYPATTSSRANGYSVRCIKN